MKHNRSITLPALAAMAALLFMTASSFGQQTAESTAVAKAEPLSVKKLATSPAAKPAAKTSDASDDPKPAADDDSKWHFELRPYLWAAGLNGSLRAGNQTVQVKQDFSDILGMLDFAMAAQFEAGKGRWRMMIDENYVNMGTEVRGPNGNVTFDVQPTMNIFEGGGSFLLGATPHKGDDTHSRPPAFSAELIGGVRYIRLHVGLRPQGGTTEIAGTTNLVGGFVGNRYKINVSRPITLIGKWTVGTSGVKSNIAATAAGYVDVRFSKKYSVMGGYQFMDIHANDPANRTGFEGQMKGIFVGFTSYF